MKTKVSAISPAFNNEMLDCRDARWWFAVGLTRFTPAAGGGGDCYLRVAGVEIEISWCSTGHWLL